MRLAACFQTKQHVREAPLLLPPGWRKQLADCGGAADIQMRTSTFLSIHTQQLSLMQEEKKRLLVLRLREKGWRNKGRFVEEGSPPAQPDTRLAAQSLLGYVHTSAALIGTQAISFSHTA